MDGVGRPEVTNVFDQCGARRGEPDPAVAGREDRALANRMADTVCEQSAAPQRRRRRQHGGIDPQMGVDEPGLIIVPDDLRRALQPATTTTRPALAIRLGATPVRYSLFSL